MKTQQQKVRVNIERGQHDEQFVGTILAQTNTHYFVQHGTRDDGGEWFAMQSKNVNCFPVGNAVERR